LDHLRTLEGNTVGDWDVWFKSPDDDSLIKGRLISIIKSKEAIKKAHKKLKRNASKKGHCKTKAKRIAPKGWSG
jgi:hypothetical protein